MSQKIQLKIEKGEIKILKISSERLAWFIFPTSGTVPCVDSGNLSPTDCIGKTSSDNNRWGDGHNFPTFWCMLA